jgi:hypothetical protein
VDYFNQSGKGIPISQLDKDCHKLTADLSRMGQKNKDSKKEDKKAKPPTPEELAKLKAKEDKAAKKRPSKLRA